MDKEKQFLQGIEYLKRIEKLQTQAIQHYDEGMIILGYYKFSNENHLLGPNSLQVTPAFIGVENFKLVENDRSKFSIEPDFEDSRNQMCEDEYNYENEEYFKSRAEGETIFKTLGINEEDQPCTKAAKEFLQSLESYLELAKLLSDLRQKQ